MCLETSYKSLHLHVNIMCPKFPFAGTFLHVHSFYTDSVPCLDYCDVIHLFLLIFFRGADKVHVLMTIKEIIWLISR